MPYFYHYTDEEGAQNIVRSGRVMVTLSVTAGGDAAYGNGVYLTKMSPTFTKEEIAMNNWMQTTPQFIRKTNNYFVFDIPDSDVEDKTGEGRNIFLLGKKNDLLLTKYPWWLKNFDTGRIIASYKYQISSLGPASKAHPSRLGNFVITEGTVNARPVYKSDKDYLFMSSYGKWIVGKEAGVDTWCFSQKENRDFSLGPDSNVQWGYAVDGKFMDGDDTLKVCGWQK